MHKYCQKDLIVIKTDFSGIVFRGRVRDYQQHILDRLDQYGKDNKIHIVAAPGSGKTVLGLEIMRRFDSPALILSPNTVIQHQWFSRFAELFLSDDQSLDDYTSYTVKSPRLLTSITYQYLHTAWNKLQDSCEEDKSKKIEDFSGFDIVDFIKQSGIKTICLDEAHHLKKSWHLALEQFVKSLPNDLAIVSLTATPPYDSTPSEWSRYISLCGDIDDEIAVPLLVKEGTLAPHQDFLYFNTPLNTELLQIESYQAKVEMCITKILATDLLENLLSSGGIIPYKEDRKYWLYINTRKMQLLLRLAHGKFIEIPKKLKKDFFKGKIDGKYSVLDVQDAFTFILDNKDMFDASSIDRLEQMLLTDSMLHSGRISFISNDKLNRELVNSTAKLKSIGEIARAEENSLNDALRLVVITDYIRKETLPAVGTNQQLNEISVVSVFETLRRSIGTQVKLAALSGSLIILPDSVIDKIDSDCYMFSCSPIKDTGYSKIEFVCTNFKKVDLVTDLFEKGEIKAIVGTKALLGEGWNSPTTTYIDFLLFLIFLHVVILCFLSFILLFLFCSFSLK